jgi:hypothetical protein
VNKVKTTCEQLALDDLQRERTESELVVQVYGPFPLGNKENSILSSPLGNLKGVYLWAIPFENSYLIYYVGETGVSFAARNMEHIKCYLNGFYRIYEPDAFAKGEKILLWGGMWKSNRKGSDTMLTYLHQYHQLSILSYKFLDQFNVFVIPINEDDRRIRQRIEAAIAYKLLEQDGIIAKFQDSDIRYFPRRRNEQPRKIKVNANKLLLGLPNELTI